LGGSTSKGRGGEGTGWEGRRGEEKGGEGNEGEGRGRKGKGKGREPPSIWRKFTPMARQVRVGDRRMNN